MSWQTDVSVWADKPDSIQVYSDDGREQDYVPERTCHIVKAFRKYVLTDGTELFDDSCSKCNGELAIGDNYCPNCGEKAVKRCSECSGLINLTDRFCPNCGAKVVD